MYLKWITLHFLLPFFVHFLKIKGMYSKGNYYRLREDLGEEVPVDYIQFYSSITLVQDCAILCDSCHSFYYNRLDFRCMVYTGSKNPLQYQSKPGYRIYQHYKSDECESVGFSLTGNICFHVVDISMSWNEARSVCKTLGADLMTIKTKAKHAAMVEKLEENPTLTRGYIIGMTDSETEGQMKWVDGEVVGATYSLFYDSQPNNKDIYGGSQNADCVAMRPFRNWKFVDVDCDSQGYAGICEVIFKRI